MAGMAFANEVLDQWWNDVATPDPRIRAESDRSGKAYVACILIHPVDAHSGQPSVWYDPGLSEELQEKVAAESLRRVDSFLQVGPADEPYLWQLRSDGDYQVWLVGEDLPELSSEQARDL